MNEANYALLEAHKHSACHEEELANSDLCGCFYCLRIYEPTKITEWISHGTGCRTAICAYCPVDSVIGSASGYPITEDFLRQMHHKFFES